MAIRPVSAGQVLEVRERLLEACSTFVGWPVLGERFALLARAMHEEVLTTDLRATVDSLRSLAGQTLTAELLDEAAWRIAGNLHRLRAGEPVPPWTLQAEEEWVTIQVEKVVKQFRSYRAKTTDQAMRADALGIVHRSGVVVYFTVLTGLPAGRRFDRFLSIDFCESIKHHFGFDKRNASKYSYRVSSRASWPFLDIGEFYRLRVQVLLEPPLCHPGELGFQQVRSNSGTKAWSRGIMSMRLRDDFDCPAGYPDDFACHGCPIGLEGCRAACHARTYVQADCAKCHRKGRYFDLAENAQVCVDCLAEEG